MTANDGPRHRVPGRREGRVERDPQAVEPDRGDAHARCSIADADRDAVLSPDDRADGAVEDGRTVVRPAAPRSSSSSTSPSATTRGRPRRGTPGAVNDLSLTVPAGKICVLVGPSGCGKTTSLKMVNRLIEPTSGRILHRRRRRRAAATSTELRRSIGYVIQQVGLFPHQTIGDNVATVPRLLGWDEGAPAGARRTSCWRSSGWTRRRIATATRASSRAASGSASASPGRSPPTRRSCSWTSRSARSTRSSATASRTSSCASRRSWPRRSSS